MSEHPQQLYNVAVVGATGNVGREIVNILHERDFPIKLLLPVASERSLGKQISFGDKSLDVIPMNRVDFSQFDVILSSCGTKTVTELEQILSKIPSASRPFLIDNSSCFRMEDDVPLVVPEINPVDRKFKNSSRRIIANPNCSTIQTVLVLKTIHEISQVSRVVASTYQSVSGSGKEAMDELFNQTRGIFVNQPLKPEQFTKRIAFNVIPHIDIFMEDGSTKEEWKMAVETKKILDPKIKLHATCVRVPVFIGHGIAIHVECENEVEVDLIRDRLRETEGIAVVDHRNDEGYVTPEECSGEDLVYVSRIRKDPTVKNGISMWIVADNLRKGAALNAVQIAENLLQAKIINKK